MKKIILVLLFPAVFFIACKSNQTAAPSYVERTSTYVVVEHKATAIGQDVPDWVTLYIAEGLTGIERLPAYQDKYVFIGEDTGTNLNALRQWSTGFTVNQEIARMISNRVRAKFVGAAAGSPDTEYGRYFEDVVQSVAEATFSGARRENDFWLLKRYFKADGRTVDREAYEFYVLVTIDRSVLEEQVTNIINGVRPSQPVTAEQQTAINRVREAFYEGF